MNNNIKPAKDKADKAYNDQVAYQKELEDGLTNFSNDLNNKKKAEQEAQQKVDNTQNAITGADVDMHDNIKPAKDAADKAYNDAINDQDVKYFDAKDAAKADQDAATQAANKAANSTAAANSLKQAAQNAYDAANTALQNANRQLQRDMSAWRRNKSHANALAVYTSRNAVKNAQSKFDAAKHTLDNMNNYDTLKNAKVVENNAEKALEDANAAVANDNSEWNQEAQAAAQRDFDTATTNRVNAEKAFKNDNDSIAKYVAAKDTADADQAATKAHKSQSAADAIKQAAQDAVNKANRQVQRDLSAYRHNPTHENAVNVYNSKAAADAAQDVLDNMNNYDAYLTAKDDENAKLNALQNAQEAEVNDPSEWNEAALDQAQNDYNDAQTATADAQKKIADKLNLANSRPALKDAMDKAYNDQVAYIQQLEDGLNNFSNDLNNAKKATKDAQKKVDDTKKAISDANDDMVNNIKPAKDAADKAYDDQVAYIQQLEDGLNRFSNNLNNANHDLKAAQDMFDAARNDETKATHDLDKARNNKVAADKLVSDAMAASDTAHKLAKMITTYAPASDDHDNTNPSKPADNNNNNNQTPADNNNAGVDADVNNGAAEGTAAANNGAVSMTRAEYREAQQNAAKKNSLPQTGNNDSSAVVALGAVSAMLGLGLAAKKREF